MQKVKTRRNTNRIPQHDYSTPGQYFLTICVEGRQQILGAVENDEMILNDAGKIVDFWWREIGNHFTGIELDQYIIMPNHIHGIINIVGVDRCVDPLNHNGRTHRSAPTISTIIQWFKTMTTNKYMQNVRNNNWQSLDKRLWQRNYYDHIVRNDTSLNQISGYIINNPLSWKNDIENPLSKTR